MYAKLGLIFLTSLAVYAFDTSAQDGPKAFHTALETCRTETGVPKAENGSKPSFEDRAKMDSCLESKGFKKPQGGPHPKGRAIREAMDGCFSELGITRPVPGSRPSEEDRQKMKTCMQGKGFTRHEGDERPHHKGGTKASAH